VVFAAQSQILKKTYHDYQKTKPDEVYYVNAQGQNNGSYTKYNYNGAKAVEATFLNGTLNGPGKEYYTKDGASKLKITGSYKNGEKHGQWITYTYVKYGQSYFNIIQSMMFNDKEVDIFNTGVQTKVNEEVYDNGKLTKEIIYHLTGKIATSRNFINKMCTGEYLAYNSKNNLTIKGTIGEKGKMIGEWTIPRKEDGTSADKNNTEEAAYTQKIKFDNNGNLDTNYVSKSYYLSGKLRDSVHVISLEFPGGYNYSGIWFLCGKNKLVKGSYRSFYETGKTKSEGQFKIENTLSVKTGIWKNYDANGILINEVNEDEIREKATESKKEAERLKQEIIEKEKNAQEEKLAKEKRDIAELQILIVKADSLIENEKNLGVNFQNLVQKKYSIEPPLTKYTVENTGSGYLYVVNKKPDLTYHFYEIHRSFEDQVEKLKAKDKEIIRKVEDNESYNQYRSNKDKIAMDFDELSTRKNIYTEMIELGLIYTKLNGKLVQLAEVKTKELEKQLKEATSAEEKIKILENYQFEPK
jgi:antitoxin component YwqK of YwqJK toxin-antitoxin module